MQPILRKATSNDISSVVSLYKDAAGREGCTWNEYYPTLDDASFDYEKDCLYVYEYEGKIIGAVSVVYENELDDKDFWKVKENVREIARVTISKEYSGHGFAGQMTGELLDILASEGCKAVHILAAKCNKAALQTYKKLGFEIVSDCFMYGNDYFAEEKIL